MGNIFTPPQANVDIEYVLKKDAWNTQSRRVRKTAESLETMKKDIGKLNVILGMLRVPNKMEERIMRCRLYTQVKLDNTLSKILWKFGDNTIVRVDVVRNSKRSAKEQLDEPLGTASLEQVEDLKANDKDKNESLAIQSFRLSVNEFYYLFLFFYDKLDLLTQFVVGQNGTTHKDSNEVAHLKSLLFQKSVTSLRNRANSDVVEDELQDNPGQPQSQEQQQQQQQEQKQDKEQGDEGVDMDIDHEHNPPTTEEQKVNEVVSGDDLKEESDNNMCSICFSEVENGIVLGCTHQFCEKCITDWRKESNNETCPYCLTKISPNEIWDYLDDSTNDDYFFQLLQFPVHYVKLFSKWPALQKSHH
ncbi:hypothetical protein RFI_24598 [Reticulomyxa filosa]|uniref:RING-type E3 ubiquitin transferase n=1 Tax=Reticulomyxa filosa TaxID=46433 RepID=X6MGJ4_RETFI|nr:hypothetical protein RFI_24598 [Reticulomyxa filosa]|eukprot:ETO12776.1 hypothetical protein RFI_24598 [Reticulomyxa filosa]